MNATEWTTFEDVAHMCYNGGFSSINVASKRRSDAIWAAYLEMLKLRRQEQVAPELLAALEAVEWIPIPENTAFEYCPWCENCDPDGHAPDCQRQAAIAKAKGES